WMINRGSFNPLSAKVKLYYNEESCLDILEAERLVVAKQNAENEWDNVGQTDPSPPTGPQSNGFVLSQALDSFSPFTIASDGPGSNILPITLLSFQASAKDITVQTSWITASEINNDFFTIERSKDGRFWEKVGTLDGAGDSHTELSYSFTDDRPYAGISYYRLKQTDFDGTSNDSEPRAVEIRQNGDFGIDKVYHGQDGLNVIYRATAPYVVVEIYDLLGKRVYGELLENSGNGFETIYPDLARGAYLLRLSHGGEMDAEKFFY
ncbi:MAG TPA: T9SS type A sorting domain-containing protein, partial [Cryomorphaceae bacterium]|nr:T9SS type A sorting domain-containing protein [Cryomorphaceae bacterium]